MKTARVMTGEGPREVEAFGKFSQVIDGRRFNFVVTESSQQTFGRSLTHVESGMKVCEVTAAVMYLSSYRKAPSDVERAKVSLQQLIDRVGADRVRCVISQADPLPKP